MLTESEITELISGIGEINQSGNEKDEKILRHLLGLSRGLQLRAYLLKRKVEKEAYIS